MARKKKKTAAAKHLARAVFAVAVAMAIFIFVQREWDFREELSERPLPEGLHPAVEEKAAELIRLASDKGIDVVITDGYRSDEEQERLYAQGRTASGQVVTHARAGGSYHNFGLAVDYALRTPDGRIIWDIGWDGNQNGKSDWMETAEIAKSLGFAWGGDWNGFKDYPHLEMTFGLSLRELRAGWRPEDRGAAEASDGQ
ncbi:M15 family metallopeptidase [Bhargavaea ullalensis]|uniref:Peptidoglycan L-alanyl-D-glutamate endopeptidase CwlK n=1 Tax=Bhargavaea ullalensis TaxID=1265685 RepID=A0ABV2G7E0_9BACL